jgi:hypothetical protein
MEGMEQEGQELSLPLHLWHTHLEGHLAPPSHTHLCPSTPAHPQLLQPQQQRQPAQRSAAQRTVLPTASVGQDPAVAGAHAGAQTPRGSTAVAAAVLAPGGAAGASDRGCAGVWGSERQGTAAGARAGGGGNTCDTVQRHGGGGSYPMAREDRERPLSRGRRPTG